MKIALITTTINVPAVLALYRKYGPDVPFYVAADEKTPREAYEFCASIPNCELYSPGRQRELGYECSALLGWNNDSRRNIALLEAVKDGAEVVVTIDDDMVTLQRDMFAQIDTLFSQPFSGPQLGSPGYWFDAGRFTLPPYPQRGLPLGYSSVFEMKVVDEVRVGVVQGIITGVPDTDAVTMASAQPHVHGASALLQAGFVVDPMANAVFNSQWTAFSRELAPAAAQFYPWQKRNTDIFASLVMRRVMQGLDLFTYFGPPVGFHNRSPRDPIKDLQAEMFGLAHVNEFNSGLGTAIPGVFGTTIDFVRALYRSSTVLPRDNVDCALAFLADLEKVL